MVIIVIMVPVTLPDPDPGPWRALTDREQAVARLAAQALTNQQIARRLGITTHTVNFHLRQVYAKLGIDSRVSLARHLPDG
ncbi:helix-turn-helix domain-containing protein [Symbioplanes lichenis]|uniref:helix-turn-helix domain-containing protein n=1 Tax=Symbioplanes lichenis TaxID=1629072 RepID=UPI00273944B7|nr:helix-turn-helix transcriptional regulator [Actinoplanes lichenis]